MKGSFDSQFVVYFVINKDEFKRTYKSSDTVSLIHSLILTLKDSIVLFYQTFTHEK